MIVWYLILFGFNFNTSQQIPQASREQCVANAAWYEHRLGAIGDLPHAFCFQGAPR